MAARVGRLVYGASDPRAGACGTLYNLCNDPRLNHELAVTDGVRAGECGALLSSFFGQKRVYVFSLVLFVVGSAAGATNASPTCSDWILTLWPGGGVNCSVRRNRGSAYASLEADAGEPKKKARGDGGD